MNLIERLRDLAGNSTVGGNTMSAFEEAAGEVERCWAEIESRKRIEVALQAEIENWRQIVVEGDAEIARLKAAKDLDALARASQAGYQHGFRTAITTLWPVVGTLLKDHHHGEEA